MNDKICPLLAIATAVEGTTARPCCLESRCAWYDFSASTCGVAALSDGVQAVSDALDTMSEEATP